jgi:hypothetical protein
MMPSPLGGAWPVLIDSLLRGIAHALSNRTGALMALTGLDPADQDDESRALLPSELSRLHDLTRLIKLLPADVGARSEAILVGDVIAEAVALLSLHPLARDLQWRVEGDQESTVVRAERWALLRLLLLTLNGARSDADKTGADTVLIRVAGDSRNVSVVICAAGQTGQAAHVPNDCGADNHTRELTDRLTATLTASAGRYELCFPALEEIRRVERERESADR